MSSRVVPSASCCSPLTAIVLRRSSRAGVERRRWATLRPKQAAVTRTPAAASPSEWMPSALTQKPVSAGKAPQAAANQKSVWKRPPASSRLYARTTKAPAATKGARLAETTKRPAIPMATAPPSPTAASAQRVRSESRVPSGWPFSSSSAWAAIPTAKKKAPSAAQRRTG